MDLSGCTFKEKLFQMKSDIVILRRIPQAARQAVADHLSSLINTCVNENSVISWHNLMTFSYKILHITKEKKNVTSLATRVKNNVKNNQFPPLRASKQKKIKKEATKKQLCSTATKKLEDGDIGGR